MRPLRMVRSRAFLLPESDLDTDQIYPGRFLRLTSRSGLARCLFADRRGAGFALDDPRLAGAEVLFGGPNFGCGSSREHAVWALLDAGLRAVVAPGFGDIFRANALKNGLLPVELPPADWRRAAALLSREPLLTVEIDVERLRIGVGETLSVAFALDGFHRDCLLRGVDELDLVLESAEAASRYFRDRAPGVDTIALLAQIGSAAGRDD